MMKSFIDVVYWLRSTWAQINDVHWLNKAVENGFTVNSGVTICVPPWLIVNRSSVIGKPNSVNRDD
jgi:hypothetical protein